MKRRGFISRFLSLAAAPFVPKIDADELGLLAEYDELSKGLNAAKDSEGMLTSLDLSDFDESKVVDMSAMFAQCSRLETLDVSDWDTSNVENLLDDPVWRAIVESRFPALREHAKEKESATQTGLIKPNRE